MTKEQFAQMINGRQRREELTPKEADLARELGLVVVYGVSDDAVMFEGSIYDEVIAWEGTTIYISKHNAEICTRSEMLSLYLQGVHFNNIDVIWCPEKEGESEPYSSWLIDAETLDTASFNIYDGDELFCIGLVFEYSQLIEDK